MTDEGARASEPPGGADTATAGHRRFWLDLPKPPPKPAPPVSSMPSIVVDPATGLIRIATSEFHTRAEFEVHFDALAAVIDAKRQARRPVRILIDLREAPVLSAEVSQLVQARSLALYRAEDRVAMVVGSLIARMQARRLFDHPPFRLCETVGDAEAWLAERG